MTYSGSSFTLGTYWDFNNQPTEWTTPYRFDVRVSNRSPNTIAIPFLGAVLNPDGSLNRVNRELLSSSDDGTSWGVNRQNIQYYNWVWDSQNHLEWYRGWMDFASNTLYDTWDEDHILWNGQYWDKQVFTQTDNFF